MTKCCIHVGVTKCSTSEEEFTVCPNKTVAASVCLVIPEQQPKKERKEVKSRNITQTFREEKATPYA